MSKKKEIVSGFTEEEINELMYKGTSEYVHLEHTIKSCDEEDGGRDNYLVIRRKSDNKCFHARFTDWEYMPDGHCKTDDEKAILVEFEECLPKSKTVVIYE